MLSIIIKISLPCVLRSLHRLYTIQSSQHLCEEATVISGHFTVEETEAQKDTPPTLFQVTRKAQFLVCPTPDPVLVAVMEMSGVASKGQI